MKNFIYQTAKKKIIKNNTIFLIGKLGNKNLNLLQFYLPKSKLIQVTEIPKLETIYAIMSDKDISQFNDSISPKLIKLKEFKNINLVKIN